MRQYTSRCGHLESGNEWMRCCRIRTPWCVCSRANVVHVDCRKLQWRRYFGPIKLEWICSNQLALHSVYVPLFINQSDVLPTPNFFKDYVAVGKTQCIAISSRWQFDIRLRKIQLIILGYEYVVRSAYFSHAFLSLLFFFMSIYLVELEPSNIHAVLALRERGLLWLRPLRFTTSRSMCDLLMYWDANDTSIRRT